uniref:NADP-dependent oxidoreductase domain-containing protein n=1 Tax=Entomoneis paludosa TaxID=265537 RepID=A0A7S2YJS3_9STRA|mmetsp:Transcript_35686/g.74256  ORF Transcript_35686/g.74256 Transcript_35686/m.74256 type:complete len:309 (+) Transcript_35686:186-1112(+)
MSATHNDGRFSAREPSLSVTPRQPQQKDQPFQFAPIPQLAFGLYQIPCNQDGEAIIAAAISSGYRHFDGGEFYQNEECLGRAIRASGISRKEFYITGKVWKDAIMVGGDAVENSVDASLKKLGFNNRDESYFDLMLLHWPVPGHFVKAYDALQKMYHTGKVRALGLSNFNQLEYKELMSSGIVTIPPICNQMEVSAIMYRPDLIRFFQQEQMIVIAFKPLQRGGLLDQDLICSLAKKYSVSVPQLLLRWTIQHGLAVACKTSLPQRMAENRSVWHFTISSSDVELLDQLTTPEDIAKRTEREEASKQP